MAKYLALVAVVIAVTNPVFGVATWGQMKECIDTIVDACRSKCRAEASMENAGEAFNACEEEIIAKTLTAEENCYKRHGWTIGDSSTCFKDDDDGDDFMARFRRQNQYADLASRLRVYSRCIRSCKKDPDILASAGEDCDPNNCPELTGQTELRARAACKGRGDRTKQRELSGIVSKGISCMLPALLG